MSRKYKTSRRSKSSRKSKSSRRSKSKKSARKFSGKSSSIQYKKCYSKLSDKIKKNLKEYKSGRYVSRQQAIAVSYSQVKDKIPSCKRYFSRK